MKEQPDPVCKCGKTSVGICPRCGQNMQYDITGQFANDISTGKKIRCQFP